MSFQNRDAAAGEDAESAGEARGVVPPGELPSSGRRNSVVIARSGAALDA